MEVVKRLQSLSAVTPDPVQNAWSSWAPAAIAMETTEQKICLAMAGQEREMFQKNGGSRSAGAGDKDGYYDEYSCGVGETDADTTLGS